VDPPRQIDYVHNVRSALAVSKFIDPMTAAHCGHWMTPRGETRGFSGLRRALQGGEACAEILQARDVCIEPLVGRKRMSKGSVRNFYKPDVAAMTGTVRIMVRRR
jgi:hypothetical protein